MHVNSTCVNKIEAMYGRSRVNVKVKARLIFTFTPDLSYITSIILQQEKFLQSDWLRAMVFQLNMKYLHVKISNLLWVVV